MISFYFPKNIKDIFRILKSAGFEAYMVGGCVRDLIMNKTPSDYDITTNAVPSDIISIFSENSFKVLPTGIAHGTVTVISDNSNIEITTYRSDGEYKDSRHPDSVKFGVSLKEDLARRDFKINAMACSVDGEIIDPFGGTNDISNSIISCVGDPNTRFSEDTLRMLRALRFSSTLNFRIEKETHQAIIKNKFRLKNISVERIEKEFSKLLLGESASHVLTEYKDVIKEIIPAIWEADDLCFIKMADALEMSTDDLITRLVIFTTAFLNKVSCKSSYSFELISDVLKKIKYPNKTIKKCLDILGEMSSDINNIKILKFTAGKIGFENTKKLIDIKYALKEINKNEADDLKNLLDDLEKNGECVSIKNLSVNGHDLISIGYTQNSFIKETLSLLLKGVIDGKTKNTRTDLLKEAEKILISARSAR